MGLQSVERGTLIIESSLKHLQIYHIFILLCGFHRSLLVAYERSLPLVKL